MFRHIFWRRVPGALALAAAALAVTTAAALAASCATTHGMWPVHDMRRWHLLQLHHPTV